jgi:hypothetical protein
LIANVPSKAQDTPIKAGPAGKSLGWDDIKPSVISEQQDPVEIDKLAQLLPKVDAIVFFFSPNPKQWKAWEEVGEKVDIPDQVIWKRDLKDKKILFAMRNFALVRAAVKAKLRIVFLSSVFNANPDLKFGTVVCIKDHINISGVSPLVGKNKSGERFPSLDNLYKTVPGIPALKNFYQFSFSLTSRANGNAVRILGGDCASTMGPMEAIVARHAGGNETSVTHIGFCLELGEFIPWVVEIDQLHKILFE